MNELKPASEPQAQTALWPPLAVQVPTLSPTSPAPAEASTNQVPPRGTTAGTPFSAFDGEDLLKLEAELGEGSCRQMLAEDQSPGSRGFVWPANSPPVTRLPTLAGARGAPQDGGHVAPIQAQTTGQEKEKGGEFEDEVKSPVSGTPKQSGTPKGGILSPKRAPPPPPTQIPIPLAASPAAAAPATDGNPQTSGSPSKMRNKAESVTLDWATGEDSWLHFDDPPPTAAAPNADPPLADVIVADFTIPSADIPLSAAYLSAKVHPEPEGLASGYPLSPDSLAAPSPSVKAFLGEFNRGPLPGQGFAATEKPETLAFASLASSFFNVSTPPAGNSPSTSLLTGFSAVLEGQSSPVVGGSNPSSAPGSPGHFKFPLRKPPPPPSGLKKAGAIETPNPKPQTPNTAPEEVSSGESGWAQFGKDSKQKAPGSTPPQTANPTAAQDGFGFPLTSEPLSPSSDLFLKVGGLGAPAKLPPEWTALRPNPVYEPNGTVFRRRSSDGDIIQEKKRPSVAEPEAKPSLTEIEPPQALVDVASPITTSESVMSQPTSPDSSRMNLLEDDWFPTAGQTPTSPPASVGTPKADTVVGLRPLGEADRKKCAAAFAKIARAGREYVSRAEAEGILSRANIPGQPFEKIW